MPTLLSVFGFPVTGQSYKFIIKINICNNVAFKYFIILIYIK